MHQTLWDKERISTLILTVHTLSRQRPMTCFRPSSVWQQLCPKPKEKMAKVEVIRMSAANSNILQSMFP